MRSTIVILLAASLAVLATCQQKQKLNMRSGSSSGDKAGKFTAPKELALRIEHKWGNLAQANNYCFRSNLIMAQRAKLPTSAMFSEVYANGCSNKPFALGSIGVKMNDDSFARACFSCIGVKELVEDGEGGQIELTTCAAEPIDTSICREARLPNVSGFGAENNPRRPIATVPLDGSGCDKTDAKHCKAAYALSCETTLKSMYKKFGREFLPLCDENNLCEQRVPKLSEIKAVASQLMCTGGV